ncbi:MAG: hypothetical protein GX804_09945, partial [Lentisphaerae bacterium]|nr:hypothetical protein [Lentisphaerota bacterium]
MAKSMNLNGSWGLTWAEGSSLMQPGFYTKKVLAGRQLFPATVPAPIHTVLEEAGVIEDINFGLNSLKARWVEEMFWIYRRTFTATAEMAEQSSWLIFEHIEFDAVVWLNGEEVGRHENANRPAKFEITGKVREGENLLVVQTSTGMHGAAEKPAFDYHSGDIG